MPAARNREDPAWMRHGSTGLACCRREGALSLCNSQQPLLNPLRDPPRHARDRSSASPPLWYQPTVHGGLLFCHKSLVLSTKVSNMATPVLGQNTPKTARNGNDPLKYGTKRQRFGGAKFLPDGPLRREFGGVIPRPFASPGSDLACQMGFIQVSVKRGP